MWLTFYILLFIFLFDCYKGVTFIVIHFSLLKVTKLLGYLKYLLGPFQNWSIIYQRWKIFCEHGFSRPVLLFYIVFPRPLEGHRSWDHFTPRRPIQKGIKAIYWEDGKNLCSCICNSEHIFSLLDIRYCCISSSHTTGDAFSMGLKPAWLCELVVRSSSRVHSLLHDREYTNECLTSFLVKSKGSKW